MRASILIITMMIAGCGPTIVERPIMAPVDTPRAARLPKGVTVRCAVEFPAITLPTTAEEQAAGRQADREIARQAIEECDDRRARAVQHSRRRGAAR